MVALRITSHEELVALVPHLLGFEPQESMVCVPLGHGVPTARVDLPRAGEDAAGWTRALIDVFAGADRAGRADRADRVDRLALVAVSAHPDRALEALSSLQVALEASVHGPRVGPVMWVDEDRWVDLLTDQRGVVSAESKTRLQAEFVVTGHGRPAASRESLASELRGGTTTLDTACAAASKRWRALDPAGVSSEAAWVGRRITRFRGDRVYLDDQDAARVLVAAPHPQVQRATLIAMPRHDATVVGELWQDLVRRAPHGWRDFPATLLGLSCFLAGRGAHAWTALDQVTQPNPLATMVSTALTRAINPARWDGVTADLTASSSGRVPNAGGVEGASMATGLSEPAGPMPDPGHDAGPPR